MEKQNFKLPKLSKNDKLVATVFEQVIQDESVMQFVQKYELDQDFVLDNLAIFLRYIEENKPCKNCPGIKNCVKEPMGYDTILALGDGDLEIVYRKCEKNLAQNRVTNNYYFRDFDEEWLDIRFSSIAMNPERKLLFSKLVKIFSDDTQKNFYIHNGRSVGKSYMAAALSNEVVFSLNKSAAFVNAKLLMDRLRDYAYTNKQEYNQMLAKLEDAYLVVIDDVGSEKVTELSIDILTSIVDTRLKKSLLTIFTSNYSIQELTACYSNYQLKAKRLFSRLINSYEELFLDGLDYRRVK